MTESEFNDLVDETLEAIEDAIDAAQLDVDVENNAGVLTVRCAVGGSIIISRQSASQELWLAAKSGGFHYRYDEGAEVWINTRDGSLFVDQLSQAFLEQAGTSLRPDF